MMIVSFDLGVPFCQIVVYDPGNDVIIHDWTEQQGRQGFSWRPSSVAFGMIGQAPELSTEIWLANEINLRADTVRAILVPFDVGESRTVRISDVADLGKEVPIVQGKYELVFETGFINEEEYKNYNSTSIVIQVVRSRLLNVNRSHLWIKYNLVLISQVIGWDFSPVNHETLNL
ncbi:hypothetical protein NUACC26_088230 [Scytonema sp. NUACC26]